MLGLISRPVGREKGARGVGVVRSKQIEHDSLLYFLNHSHQVACLFAYTAPPTQHTFSFLSISHRFLLFNLHRIRFYTHYSSPFLAMHVFHTHFLPYPRHSPTFLLTTLRTIPFLWLVLALH